MAAAATAALVVAAPAWAASEITSPTNGSRINDSTPTFTGTATGGGSPPAVTVKIYAGPTATGTAIRTLTATPDSSGAWSASVTAGVGPTGPPLPEATYTARPQQGADPAGDPVTFTVDTTLPDLTFTSPGAATRDTTPLLGGGKGNADSDSDTVNIKLYQGGTASGPVIQTLSVTRDNVTWGVGAADLADGQYTAQATQSDTAGNVATATRTFTVDTAPPALTMVQPPDGTDASPTFTGTASDAGGVTVRVYSGGNVVQTLGAANGASGWSVDASPDLAPGTYAVQATQTDAAGNTGASPLYTFTVSAPAAPTSTGGVTPTSTAPTTGTTSPGTTAPTDTGPVFLSPFPIVRIVGSLTRKGVKLSVFNVRAPAGSTVQVRCRGKSCPFKTRSSAAGERNRTVRIKRLVGRSLRAGVVIEVRVSHVERWGKFTRFRIRKGLAPLRADSCLRPNQLRPVRCP